jgi:hypothetical protein
LRAKTVAIEIPTCDWITAAKETELTMPPEQSSTLGSSRALYKEWERAHKPHPPTLYHYTTAQGLLSMVRSGHIWATESRYMNDPREFVHGAEVLLSVIDRLLARKNPLKALFEVRDSVARHVAEKLQNVRIFCACFCTEGDLLSQWRGYGDSGGGYALGFTPRLLFGPTPQERPPLRSLFRVLYERKQQERWVERWCNTIGASRSANSNARFWRFFSEAIISFKDAAYAEEGEWRLVQFGRAWSSKGVWLHPVQFRERKGQIVPYADIDLSQSKGAFAGRLPISEIVHGPTQDPERSGKALRLFVEDCGYQPDHLALRRSIVPFRGS